MAPPSQSRVRNSTSPTGELTVTRDENDIVVARLAGRWSLEGGLPSPRELERELASADTAGLAFDTSRLGPWDSAVLATLV